MITFNPLQFVAVAFVACGLLAVVLELALKDPRGLSDMIDDVRHFAERPKSVAPAWHPKAPSRTTRAFRPEQTLLGLT